MVPIEFWLAGSISVANIASELATYTSLLMQAALDRSGLFGDEVPAVTSGATAPGTRFDLPARLAYAVSSR
jgi:hypothetical protein